ncbi:MAG TPA: ACP S-malonyltransferase, partial [Planctomycetota bacterium]|nr:ACP S-malonyltransferase [Planctomycetota bacterium]
MRSTVAFLFPGQGAQAPGMAVDLADAYPEARAVFERGREVLGRDILAIARGGPEEELSSTRTSQPAIFLHSMAALEVLGSALRASAVFPGAQRFCQGVPALAAAGLSLGEYSALVFAGSLDFEDALGIVGLRAELMQDACDETAGAMASVIGLAAEKVAEVVDGARARGLRVSVANYNSPDQTVISGEAGAVDATVKLLDEAGARRAIRLKVAGAYHSELMASATRKLEPHLRKLKIRPPRLPFYSNVSGTEVSDPEEIRANLIRQVESSVRWHETVKGLVGRGLRRALEVGPGRVLAGLLRGVSRDVEVVAAGTCEGAAR